MMTLQTEKSYGALSENALDAVLLTRPDGIILYANPAASALFGYTIDEFRRNYRCAAPIRWWSFLMSDPELLDGRESLSDITRDRKYMRRSIFGGVIFVALIWLMYSTVIAQPQKQHKSACEKRKGLVILVEFPDVIPPMGEGFVGGAFQKTSLLRKTASRSGSSKR